jgi:hypothetical protein
VSKAEETFRLLPRKPGAADAPACSRANQLELSSPFRGVARQLPTALTGSMSPHDGGLPGIPPGTYTAGAHVTGQGHIATSYWQVPFVQWALGAQSASLAQGPVLQAAPAQA